MAGNIFWKEGSLVTLSSSQGSLATATAAAAGVNMSCVSGGNCAEAFTGQFALTCQWATVTGIAAGTDVADLYLVPSLDGTNFPAIGTGVISPNHYVGSFICELAPTASTNMLFVSPEVDLLPRLYKAYIINQSGQTMSSSWSLTVVVDQGQYT